MAKSRNGLSREFIIHPGETLKEVLEERGMTQRELAVRTDVTETHISYIVNCQKDISISFAKKLEYALGVDASFWINLQGNYDKELEDFKELNNISGEELNVVKKLKPITLYMQQIELIEAEADEPIFVVSLRKLLNVSSLTRIPDIRYSGVCRLSQSANADPYVLFVWLKMCDLINSRQTIENKLDIEKLKTKLPDIKKVMFETFSGIKAKLRNIFSDCGIKFSVVKYFKGAPVQGVLKKHDDSLSLIITDRYKYADIFWFTLFHEISHIINGDIEDLFIDYEMEKNEAEELADEFSANTLIKPEHYNRFIETEDYSLNQIKQFSSEVGIPPYILIGRLQKEGYIKFNTYASEKPKYEFV